MKKWLLRIGGALLLICLVLLLSMYFRLKDKHPDYWLDLTYTTSQPGPILAGFSAVSITPEVTDTWTDVNGDARFNEEDGDTYQDVNGNGQFDPVWIAGFHNRRPAQGIHDELWARTMILDDGEFRLAYVVLDAIGYFNDDVLSIREKVSAAAEVDYIIVSSTHTHEGPDLLGLWGESEFKTGVDPVYRNFVIEQAVQSVEEAAQRLRPAELTFTQDLEGAAHLVTDSRAPHVMDPGIRILHAADIATGLTLGTLVCWSNHPETLWSKNLLLSSDFPHYVREGIEQGVS
nr:neutral/alkaline non-lysosomal ceramidase N-terminal domain-containing protein [Saprospiraceae bacterium]